MIINCSNCNTKYDINSTLINSNGRRVKCSKCQNIWLVTSTILENDNNDIENNKNFSESYNYIEKIPEVKIKSNTSLSYLLSCVLIVITLLLSLILFKERITNYYPKAQKLYDKINYYNIKNINLENIQVSKLNSQGENFLIIKGAIKNNSAKEQAIPNLLVLLEDKNKKEQNKKIVKAEYKLKPGELYNFEEIIFLINKNSSQLTLDLVNDIQLFLR